MNNKNRELKIKNYYLCENHEDTKRKNTSRAFNQLILIAIILMFFLNWSTAAIHNGLEGILSLLTTIMLAVLVLLNVKILYKNKNQFFLTMLILIIALIGMLVNSSNLGILLVIVNFLLMLLVSGSIKISQSFMLILSLMFMLLFLYWIIISPEGFNTNSIGLVSLTTYIGSSFLLRSIKGKILRESFFLVITYAVIQSIINSKSRSSIIGLIIFLLLSYVIPKRIWLNKKVLRLICLFITIGSIGFVLFYLYMWENNISFNIEGVNKNFFSGREAIWYELMFLFKDNVIFGLGSNFDLQSHPNLNVHNSMYNILVIYGIPIFVLVFIQIWRRFSFLSLDKERNKYFVISMAGFISIAIQSFFENTLISANFIPIILFLLIVANSTCNRNTQATK